MANPLSCLAEGKKLRPIDLVARADRPNIVSDEAGEATDSLPIATRRDTAKVDERHGSRDAGFLRCLPAGDRPRAACRGRSSEGNHGGVKARSARA